MKKLQFLLLPLLFFALTSGLAESGKTVQELAIAFARDGYNIVKTVEFQGQKGICAEHQTACNYETKKKKKIFYVEGSGYQMGYLLGLLASDDVETMTTKFVDNIIFDFIGIDVDPDKIPIIWGILKGIIVNGSKKVLPDVPQVYLDEMHGLVDGCKNVNPNSKVCFDDLCALNFGIDCLLATIYTLDVFGRSDLKPEDLRIPVMCNAFSVFGQATGDGKHYFGRDFMFATAGVFEHMAALTIYRPTDGRISLVSMSAPGFIGSIMAMNKLGIGIGVDMSPAGNCNPKRPGLNSLVLVRHATHSGANAQTSLDTVVAAQRGVSWFYIIADGKHDQSLVAESGMRTDNLNPLQYPPLDLKLLGLLPDQDYLNRYETQTHQQGVMVRWHDYVYPQSFFDFNKDLFRYYDKSYNASVWGERGYINPTHTDENCPKAYYFPPQRENKQDVLVLSNHCIVPSMHLCAMDPCTVLVAKGNLNDIQWRYDELNNQILNAYGNISFAKAKQLIDFLAPYGKFPDYYQHNKPSSDGKTKIVRGSVSVCNLTDKVVESHYGFYADEWVQATLPNYVGE
jgi:hypothetical protein